MFGNLPGAAPDIEDRLHAGKIELSRAEQPLAERNVQREHAAGRQESALRTAVDVFDLGLIFVEAHSTNRVVFHQPLERGQRQWLVATVRRRHPAWSLPRRTNTRTHGRLPLPSVRYARLSANCNYHAD